MGLVEVSLYGNPPPWDTEFKDLPEVVEVRVATVDFGRMLVSVDGVEIPFADIHQLHRAIEHYSRALR